MTRTKEQIRKAVFGKLRGLRQKLLAQGVPCTYARSVLSHDSGEIAFRITCRLADDQASLLPQIAVRTAAGTESLDHLPLDQGLARIKELLQAQHIGNDQEASDDTQATMSGQEGVTDTQDSNSNIVTPN